MAFLAHLCTRVFSVSTRCSLSKVHKSLNKAVVFQILLLFKARYCPYDQAGSFYSTFIESGPSQDTLGKYFFQQKPLGTQGKANRVTFLAQISTLSSIVKIFKLDFLKKPSPKKFETQDLN